MSASTLRPPPNPDELMHRYFDAEHAGLEPDPLFRRRLRGAVMNRYVAHREGLVASPERRSQMGALGRACLYASVALALSVGGTMAASRGAVPGDILYPVKLELEALRMQTFPERFHDDLVVYALTERIAEFGRLVQDGDWAHAAGLVPPIQDGYAAVAALDIELDGTDPAPPSVAVLQALTERLPEPAQQTIEWVLEAPLAEPAPQAVPAAVPAAGIRPLDPMPSTPAATDTKGGQGNHNDNALESPGHLKDDGSPATGRGAEQGGPNRGDGSLANGPTQP
jgi:hypothetical protein